MSEVHPSTRRSARPQVILAAKNRVDANWHFVDNYSWKSGKHDVKFGYEFRRTTIEQYLNKYSRGRLRFSSLEQLLQMIPSTSNFSTFDYTGDTLRHTYQNGFGLFISRTASVRLPG